MGQTEAALLQLRPRYLGSERGQQNMAALQPTVKNKKIK
jgi:hypothetical protein